MFISKNKKLEIFQKRKIPIHSGTTTEMSQMVHSCLNNDNTILEKIAKETEPNFTDNVDDTSINSN